MSFAQTGGRSDSGVKRALLIGINEYRSPLIPPLRGSLNDVEIVRDVLVARWGFSEPLITVLTNSAATRAGILAAFEQLVRDSGPNDIVYIHYSGHGSRVGDQNGDEDDGIDETIVPHDGRTAGIADIVDDELDAVLAKLRARHAVIVLDSCHSGTATRSADLRARSVPGDDRSDLYRRDTAVTTRAVVARVESRFVVLSAAAPDQEALDGPLQGRHHGFFSYALSQSLASSVPQASARHVLAGIEQRLQEIQATLGRASMPEPQLEAPPDLLDEPLFGTPSRP